jgi:hypothetical protein
VRDSDVNLYRYPRLVAEFGAFKGGPGPDGTAIAESDIVGASYRRVLAETTAIVAHQWRNDISRSALKGFLFYGGVGIGKTTMGRRLAYELTRIFGGPPSHTTIAPRTRPLIPPPMAGRPRPGLSTSIRLAGTTSFW